MSIHIPNYLFTEQGNVYFLPAIQIVWNAPYKATPDKSYWIWIDGMTNPHMVSYEDFEEIKEALGKREELIRLLLENDKGVDSI
jgi:hypothetical protein